ncbi:hypothetical protein Taro_038499 [Colocasia esculenta]|uniref:Uncharacterized protein n=1 Tax=Colocasia esculenta TaxID=4460 RepID=A0A843WG17_COLES|nr:hypothetical protein [Colocasia esculenta]
MVKCRNHPYEQGVGVCASCLRERLLAVIAAQSGRPQHCCAGTPRQKGPHAVPHLFQKQQLEEKQTPPSLLFPRSVSPYVAHRRSVDLDFPPEADERCRQRQPVRFYSTPQVGPAGGGTKGGAAGFSILSSLFGGGGRQFRSEDSEQDFVASSSGGRPVSWFSALVARGKKKKKNKDAKQFAEEMAEEDRARRGRRRTEWCRDRGMSPARDDSSGEDGSDPRSGYSTESPNEWRRPEPTPLRKPATPAHSAMSGFVFCLSPLVRASPRRSHVAEGSGPAGIAGEPREGMGQRGHCRRQHRHRLAPGGGGAPSLGPNRSRKLVDFGRFR